MLGTGQGGGKCCGEAIGEVNPSTLGKTTLLKQMVVIVVIVVDYIISDSFLMTLIVVVKIFLV